MAIQTIWKCLQQFNSKIYFKNNHSLFYHHHDMTTAHCTFALITSITMVDFIIAVALSPYTRSRDRYIFKHFVEGECSLPE